MGTAISAALAQTYSPLEIILSDDCSTDRTFQIIQEAASGYRGPHRVIARRNDKNVNIAGHVNAAALVASGELIVLAAADDVSVPVRTERLVRRWSEMGRPPVVLCSDFEPIDRSSRPVLLRSERVHRGPFTLEAMADGDIGVLGATTAVSRSVFEAFVPMDAAVRHEDRVLPFRALLAGGQVSLVDEKLVRYRVDGGISRPSRPSARNYIHSIIPDRARRTVPDARQRLADLETVADAPTSLRRRCLATIARDELSIILCTGRGLAPERALLGGIVRRAGVVTLAKLYLKRRLIPLYALYFRIRYGREAAQ